MPLQRIHFRIDEDFLKTGENLQKKTLENNKLCFFRLHAKSKNAWHSFIYELGLIKCQEEYEKFQHNLEKEVEIKK